VRAARLLAGPLALSGFFASWIDGSGALTGHRFSGFELVAFTGSLQELHLNAAEIAALAVFRVAVLGVAVAAAWLVVVTVRPSPGVYRLSGSYVALAAGTVAAIAVYQGGFPLPVGATLLLAAAGCFLFGLWTGSPAERMVRSGRVV